MSAILLGEYKNQNSRRNYPFGDEATLLDADGNNLPTDFLVDAFIYAVNLQGAVYLSQVDLQLKRIYLAEDVTNRVIGYVDFDLTSTEEYIYDDETNLRPVGVLVFGAGLGELFRGNQLRTFGPAATMFCPTAFMALNQVGVRGIKLPDGSIIVGDIGFVGQNGINVSTLIDGDGNSILYIDIVGVQEPTPEDCGEDCPNIKEVCFERMPGSVFMVSQYDPLTVAISTYGFTLDDLCAAQKAKVLPDTDGNLPSTPKTGDDPCGVSPTPPTPIAPGPHVLFCLTVTDLKGNLRIVTPSTPGAFNPVMLVDLEAQGKQDLTTLHLSKIRSAPEAADDIARFTIPTLFTNGFAIGLKGLAQYRRPVANTGI